MPFVKINHGLSITFFTTQFERMKIRGFVLAYDGYPRRVRAAIEICVDIHT